MISFDLPVCVCVCVWYEGVDGGVVEEAREGESVCVSVCM